MGSTLLQSDIGNVRLLEIDRPQALNALNIRLIEDLQQAMHAAEAEESVRVVVLRGHGNRAFAAGADINELDAMTSSEAVDYSKRGQLLMQDIESLSLPVIAAVEGFALGGGLELALACDFIYATENSTFGLVEADLGLIPGYGGVARLAQRIGESAAREALYTAKRYTSAEALKLGLINSVLPDSKLMEEVLQLAGAIATKSPGSIGLLKSLLLATRNCRTEDVIRLESQAFGMIFTDPNGQEGIRAFKEKRRPEFQYDACRGLRVSSSHDESS